MNTTAETNSAIDQARSQTSSIVELVAALRAAELADDDTARDTALEAIHSGPLELTVRSGWVAPGSPMEADEACLLLSTGGPACRIVCDVEGGELVNPRIEGQDWGTPWTEYHPSADEREALAVYVSQFPIY